MKSSRTLLRGPLAVLAIAALASFWFALQPRMVRAQSPTFQTEEYLTIRWDGRENTHVIRPNGKAEVLGQLLGKLPRPDRVDDRAFYMNAAMNAAAKEGFEFAGKSENEIVMKRRVRQ